MLTLKQVPTCAPPTATLLVLRSLFKDSTSLSQMSNCPVFCVANEKLTGPFALRRNCPATSRGPVERLVRDSNV